MRDLCDSTIDFSQIWTLLCYIGERSTDNRGKNAIVDYYEGDRALVMYLPAWRCPMILLCQQAVWRCALGLNSGNKDTHLHSANSTKLFQPSGSGRFQPLEAMNMLSLLSAARIFGTASSSGLLERTAGDQQDPLIHFEDQYNASSVDGRVSSQPYRMQNSTVRIVKLSSSIS